MLLSGGCQRYAGGSYIARVGNATLTKADIDQVRSGSRDSILDTHRYVDEWVITELLYQEAERRGITNDADVRREADEARRHFAVAALLQREVYDDTSGITEDSIQAYFDRNRVGFTLREDVINMSYAAFTDREAANAFRSALLHGTSWDQAIAAFQKDSSSHGALYQSAERQYFTRGRTYPNELWKLASTMPKGDVSFVIKVEKSFYVLIAHAVMHQGSIPDVGYVRNDVRDRLLIERRRERYERLIATLRARATVDVGAGNAPSE